MLARALGWAAWQGRQGGNELRLLDHDIGKFG
jgi:hypothetical protein